MLLSVSKSGSISWILLIPADIRYGNKLEQMAPKPATVIERFFVMFYSITSRYQSLFCICFKLYTDYTILPLKTIENSKW